MKIEELRKEIDEIDASLVTIFAKRIAIAKAIARVKKEEKLPIQDKAREESIQARIRALAQKEGLSPAVLEEIFKLFLDYSRVMMKIEIEKAS